MNHNLVSTLMIAVVFVLGELRAAEPEASVAGKNPISTASRLRVAGAQIPVTRDVQKNVETLTRAIEFAKKEKADVLVTPEGSLSGYYAEFDAEATHKALGGIVAQARAAKVALALGTCFAGDDDQRYDGQRFYNRNGEYLGFHSKTLLCRSVSNPKAKGEPDYYKTSPLRLFNLNGLTVGGLVCNDMWANPECTPMPDPHLAQQLSSMGARVIFHSVNAGQDDSENWSLNHAYHESNLRLRARAGKLWIVVCDAADASGKKPSNCPSGVVKPDGHWATQTESKGEQFFAYTIEID